MLLLADACLSDRYEAQPLPSRSLKTIRRRVFRRPTARVSRGLPLIRISPWVDLNEAANATYPVMGNFQKVRRAFLTSTGDNAGYVEAVAVDDNESSPRLDSAARFRRNDVSTSSPAYGVVYAKSFDGGATFTDTVSVSGTMRFDMMTTNLAMTGAFSTVDLAVDSKGNPRVSYAFDFSADDLQE